MMRSIGLALIVFLLSAVAAFAHEVRPAYLKISETEAGQFSASWRQPVTDGKRLKISPVFPEPCETGEAVDRFEAGAIAQSFSVKCDLKQGEIRLDGLERTLTDIFVDIAYLDGTSMTRLVKPAQPFIILDGPQQSAASQYLPIGITHILTGWDHLLFILGLTLLIGRKQIWGVATAFTVAHSLTLGLAAFSLLTVPAAPVEILIAASIVVLALELVRKYRGLPGGLSRRRPYLVGFVIGLLHGCGFAGAISEIGLPERTELLALFLFNIGVELGQFGVIALIIVLTFGLLQTKWLDDKRIGNIAAYIIGPIAVFWIIERGLGLFVI